VKDINIDQYDNYKAKIHTLGTGAIILLCFTWKPGFESVNTTGRPSSGWFPWKQLWHDQARYTPKIKQ
jgi:hypothetical protein